MKNILLILIIMCAPSIAMSNVLEISFHPELAEAYSDGSERNGNSEAFLVREAGGTTSFKGALRGIISEGRRVGFAGIRQEARLADTFTQALVRMIPVDEASRNLTLRLTFRTEALPPPPFRGNLNYQVLLTYKPELLAYAASLEAPIPVVRGVALDPNTVPAFRTIDVRAYAVEARVSEQRENFAEDFQFQLL